MMYEFAEMIGRSVWAMDRQSFLSMVKASALATPEAIQAKVVAAQSRFDGPVVVGDVAVIDVSGPITYRDSFFSMFFGASTIQGMQRHFRMALTDPAVKTILFRIDSPGGSVDMLPEFADEVFKARGQKPMIAVCDTLMCSAAYWIGVQADQVLMGSVCSWAGSIGVFVEHIDVSKALEMEGISVTLISAGEHKVDGNELGPLGKDVRARYQSEVDKIHGLFLQAVGRAREVSATDARKSYGEGLCYMGSEAVTVGVADRVATFDNTLTKLIGRRSRTAAETDAPVRMALATPEAEAVATQTVESTFGTEETMVVDEMHEHKGRDLFDALAAAEPASVETFDAKFPPALDEAIGASETLGQRLRDAAAAIRAEASLAEEPAPPYPAEREAAARDLELLERL